jgi:hypothetical protein
LHPVQHHRPCQSKRGAGSVAGHNGRHDRHG